MKSKIYLLIAVAGMITASSCKKFEATSLGDKSINSLNAKIDTDVYVAGEAEALSGRVVAAYWKNGVETKLTDTNNANNIVRKTMAVGIVVHDTDVYITGTIYTDPYDRTTAVYWRNGKMVVLADNAFVGDQQNIALSSCGCDVYIAGSAMIGNVYRAVYWKNGVQHQLPGGLKQTVANSIAIHGGNVYIAGFGLSVSGYNYGIFWQNDTPHYLTDTLFDYSVGHGIAVKGNDVYIAGYSQFVNNRVANETAVATLWKNGIPVTLIGATPAWVDSFQVQI